MVFSSLFFLYIFLPLCLLLYFIQRSLTAKNIVLVCASLVFYAWGEPVYVLLMLAVAGLFAWKKLKTPGAYVDIMIDGDSVKTLRLDQDASY